LATHHTRRCVYAVFIYISTPIPLSFAADEWVRDCYCRLLCTGGKYGLRAELGCSIPGCMRAGSFPIPPQLPDRLLVSPNLLSIGIGQLRREVSGQGLTITDVKNTWCLTGTVPYILMAWAWGLIKHRENFVPGRSVLPYSYAGTPAEQNWRRYHGMPLCFCRVAVNDGRKLKGTNLMQRSNNKWSHSSSASNATDGWDSWTVVRTCYGSGN